MLRGCICVVDTKASDGDVSTLNTKLLLELGATVEVKLSETTTHFIYCGTDSEGVGANPNPRVRTAKALGIQVVDPLWIYQCRESGERMPEVDFLYSSSASFASASVFSSSSLVPSSSSASSSNGNGGVMVIAPPAPITMRSLDSPHFSSSQRQDVAKGREKKRKIPTASRSIKASGPVSMRSADISGAMRNGIPFDPFHPELKEIQVPGWEKMDAPIIVESSGKRERRSERISELAVVDDEEGQAATKAPTAATLLDGLGSFKKTAKALTSSASSKSSASSSKVSADFLALIKNDTPLVFLDRGREVDPFPLDAFCEETGNNMQQEREQREKPLQTPVAAAAALSDIKGTSKDLLEASKGQIHGTSPKKRGRQPKSAAAQLSESQEILTGAADVLLNLSTKGNRIGKPATSDNVVDMEVCPDEINGFTEQCASDTYDDGSSITASYAQVKDKGNKKATIAVETSTSSSTRHSKQPTARRKSLPNKSNFEGVNLGGHMTIAMSCYIDSNDTDAERDREYESRKKQIEDMIYKFGGGSNDCGSSSSISGQSADSSGAFTSWSFFSEKGIEPSPATIIVVPAESTNAASGRSSISSSNRSYNAQRQYRTKRILLAVCRGVPIVSDEWLDASVCQDRFVGWESFRIGKYSRHKPGTHLGPVLFGATTSNAVYHTDREDGSTWVKCAGGRVVDTVEEADWIMFNQAVDARVWYESLPGKDREAVNVLSRNGRCVEQSFLSDCIIAGKIPICDKEHTVDLTTPGVLTLHNASTPLASLTLLPQRGRGRPPKATKSNHQSGQFSSPHIGIQLSNASDPRAAIPAAASLGRPEKIPPKSRHASLLPNAKVPAAKGRLEKRPGPDRSKKMQLLQPKEDKDGNGEWSREQETEPEMKKVKQARPRRQGRQGVIMSSQEDYYSEDDDEEEEQGGEDGDTDEKKDENEDGEEDDEEDAKKNGDDENEEAEWDDSYLAKLRKTHKVVANGDGVLLDSPRSQGRSGGRESPNW